MGFGHVEHNVNMKFNRNLLFGKANTHSRRRIYGLGVFRKKTQFLGFFYGLNRSFYLGERENPDENLIRCAFGMTGNRQHNNLCSRRSYSIISALEALLEKNAARVGKISLGFHNTLKIPSQHAISWIPIHVEATRTFGKIENSCYSLLKKRKLREWFAKIFFYFIVAFFIVELLCSVHRHFFLRIVIVNQNSIKVDGVLIGKNLAIMLVECDNLKLNIMLFAVKWKNSIKAAFLVKMIRKRRKQLKNLELSF